MLNVNQITSQLAKMPDNALQQYATMHKADPYMLALAIAESNRRKEMRGAAQGMQGAVQQPKVADQAIAGMSSQQLPEHVGIGQLPADNIKGMAGGGIVAFAEGGDTGSWDPYTGEYVIDYGTPQKTFGQKFAEAIGYGKGLNIDPYAVQKAQKAATEKRNAPETPAETARLKAQNATAQGVPTGLAAAAAAQEKAAPAAIERSGLAGAAGVGGAGTASPYKPSTLAEMMKEVSPEVEKMNAEDRAAMDPFRKQFEEERSDLAKRKESNKAEALLAAGLGMMSGGSRYALQNIGTGAQQGLASLKEATRADDAAKRALMQSEMHLAQAEMQGRKGNFQSMNQLANQARQEKQFAVSSELQRQQIANQGQYYGALAKAAAARGNMDAKTMAEYGRLQKLAEQHVKDNAIGMTEAQRSAMYQDKLNELISTNPFMRKLGDATAHEPVTREL